MRKNKVNILIVEDDSAVLDAMSRTIKNKGYNVITSDRPEEAIQITRLKNIHMAIIDCMLPKINGVDLAVKFREEGLPDQPIILMSGIFKDKNFINKAIKRTKAKSFFQKPFDMDDLLAQIEYHLSSNEEMIEKSLYQVLSDRKSSIREKVKSLDSIDGVSGLDLPLIIKLFMDSETTGYLNVYRRNGTIFGISFYKGNISNVDSEETSLIYKRILLDDKLLDSNEYDESTESTKVKDTLLSLVEKNLLSPHMLQAIKQKQVSTEIINMVDDVDIDISFSPGDVENNDLLFDKTDFEIILNVIIDQKYHINWLETFFNHLKNYKISINQSGSFENIKKYFIYYNIWEEIKDLKQPQILKEFFDKYPDKKLELSRGLLYLTLNSQLNYDFVELKNQVPMEKVKVLLDEVKGKNPFETFAILGINKKCPPSEVKNAFKNFSVDYHPDKFTSLELDEQKVVDSLFSHVSSAYQLLVNPKKRQSMEDNLKVEDAEKYLIVESLYTSANDLMSKSFYQEALDQLEKAQRLMDTEEGRLLTIKVKLKLNGNGHLHSNLLNELNRFFANVTEDTKKHKEYMYVQGLYFKAIKNYDQAYKCFSKILASDPSNLEARRDLARLPRVKKEEKPNIFKDDLGKVIKSVFNKKKSS